MDLAALLGWRLFTFEEHDLALDVILVGEVGHLVHVDELVKLLGHLLDDVLIGIDHHGHAAAHVLLGDADGKGLDVEAAARNEAGNASEPRPVCYPPTRKECVTWLLLVSQV